MRKLFLLLYILAVAHAPAQIPAGAQRSPTVSGGVVPLPVQTTTTNRSTAGVGILTGSIPTGTVTDSPLPLSLQEAVDRGLRYNLGIVTGELTTREAIGARLSALSSLLPNITSRITETSQQVNLAAFGFSGFPGIPSIVGPFQVFDARAALTQSVFSLSALSAYRSVQQDERAARFSLQNTRDAVVFTVVSLYLEAIAGAARVETARAQVQFAEAALTQSRHMNESGVAAGIDVLRAQVELQSEQSRLITAETDVQREHLNLGRAIGLPQGQQIRLTDSVPYAPPPSLTLDEALHQASASRADYQAAVAREESAQQLHRAARAQRLPSAFFNGNYGVIGPSVTNSHGTYVATVGVDIPIFDGKRIEADVQRADVLLQQRKAEAADLRGRIDYDVRTAFLDLTAARQRVELARSTVDLANQQLTQARDRFQAGVTNNLEVVQAQAAVATANEALISSLFVYNVSKASLARAVGVGQQTLSEFLGVPSQ